jgi:hypothetical protein
MRAYHILMCLALVLILSWNSFDRFDFFFHPLLFILVLVPACSMSSLLDIINCLFSNKRPIFLYHYSSLA